MSLIRAEIVAAGTGAGKCGPMDAARARRRCQRQVISLNPGQKGETSSGFQEVKADRHGFTHAVSAKEARSAAGGM